MGRQQLLAVADTYVPLPARKQLVVRRKFQGRGVPQSANGHSDSGEGAQ
jgi:hypothetical protein